jgi:hypothetical protein
MEAFHWTWSKIHATIDVFLSLRITFLPPVLCFQSFFLVTNFLTCRPQKTDKVAHCTANTIVKHICVYLDLNVLLSTSVYVFPNEGERFTSYI